MGAVVSLLILCIDTIHSPIYWSNMDGDIHAPTIEDECGASVQVDLNYEHKVECQRE